MDRMLVRSEDTRCHRGFRLLAMSERMFCVKKCAFQYVAGQATIFLRSYISIDMYISIYSAKTEVYYARENAYHQQFFRAKRRNSEPSYWSSWREDVSSLSPARLRLSSATLLSGVRPFPRNAPSVVLLMGAAPRAHKPYPQSSFTAFRADLRYASPLSASLPRSGRSPSACTCYPCPRRRVAQGLLVNNNRQYQKAERTTL
jgi:hypothetical protein